MDSSNVWRNRISNKKNKKQINRRLFGAVYETLESRQMMTAVLGASRSHAILDAVNNTPQTVIQHDIAAFDALLVGQVHAHLNQISNATFDTRITNEETRFGNYIAKLGGTYTPVDLGTLAFEATPPKLTVSVVAANHVTLSWTAVTGATSYTVEVSSGKSRAWTTLTTTAATTLDDTSLTSKTIYRYRVTATNGSVSSMTSKVVGIRPGTAAAAAERHARAIALGIQRFQRNLSRYLEKNAAQTSNPRLQEHVLQLQQAFANRLARAGLVYQPQSISSMLVGNFGGENTGPDVTATTVSSAEIDLSWTAVSGAIVYLVEVSKDGGTTWTTDAYTLTNSYDDVSLASETPYSYRVSATTSAGTSSPGATGTAITLPGTPSSLVLASDAPTTSGASFTLSWAPVTGATDYHVSFSTDPSQLTTSAASMIDAGASTSATISGLSAGSTYFVSVQAIDATFQQSAPSDIASILTTPASPTVIGASPSTSEIDLTWNAVPTATSYTVLKKTSAGTFLPDGSNVSGTSFADTKLVADTQYAFLVIANNVTGPGVPSSEADVQTLMNAPTGVVAVANNTSVGVTISWNVGDANNYIVQRSTDELNWAGISAQPNLSNGVVTYSDTSGLIPGGTYYYRVFDLNSSGSSLPSAIQTVQTVPSTTTITAVNFSSTEVDLTWQPVYGASSYYIERSTATNGSYGTLATVTSGPPFFKDKTVTPDTTFFYRITAINGTGSQGPSPEITTTTPLGSVTGLTAVANNASNGEIDLSWNVLTDANSYVLMRQNGTGQWASDSAAQTVGTDTVTVADTGLSDGTVYNYAVIAVNAQGNGAQSSAVSALTLPGAPTLTAKSVSGSEVDLSWNAVPSATSYVLQTQNSSGTWVNLTPSSPTATTFADTGLTGNTAYVFQVFAVNGTGTSPASSTQTATTLLPTPADLAVVPSQTSGGSVTLNWTPIANATGYNIERSTNDNQHFSFLNTSSLNGSSGTFTDNTTVPGTTYYYGIIATSTTEGSSIPTIASGLTLPPVPTFTAASISASEVDLTWAPAKGASSYALQKYDANSSSWTLVTGTITSPYKDTGLTADTLQQYELAAVNTTGTSAFSAEVDSTTRVSAPANLTAGAISGSAIRLNWTAVTDANSYEVDRTTDATKGPWTVLTTLNNPAANMYTDSTGLSPVTHYYYRVDAINANGASAWATADKSTLMPSPTGLTATASTANITVKWNAVTGASDYVLIRSNGSSGWIQQTLSGKGVLTFTDTSFSPDTTYQYEVGALGTNTTSGFTSPVSVTTLLGAPTGLAAAPTTAGVGLTWTPVADATSYVITRTLGNAKGVALTTTGLTGSSGSFLDTTALGNTTYGYTISAVNSLGTSLSSSAVTALTDPSTPAGLKAVSNPDGTITLNWTALTGISSYTVQEFNGLNYVSLSPNANTSSYKVTELTPDVAYTFQVLANNNTGSSLPSTTASATTVPASPVGLAATSPKATEIDLTWNAAVHATGYYVERSTDNKTWKQVVTTSAKSTTTSAADATVTAGTSYYYRISTITAAGQGQPSAALQTISRPAAVASVGITNTSSTSLNLLWATVTGASNYQISMQTGGSGPFNPLASVTSPTFTVSGLNPDTEYGFQVTASNFAGAAAASGSSFATTLLDVVKGVTATPGAPGSGQVNVAWTALTDAKSYLIERSTDDKTFTKLTSQNASTGVTFADKTIAVNTTYYYEVAAVNGFGQGAFGLSNPILTFPASPGAPTATKVTVSEVDLSWTAVTGASQYFVEGNNGITGWHGLGEASTTTFNATGLAANTAYQFRVSAINNTGPSAPSAVLTVTTAPAAVPGFAAKAVSASEIDLSWPAVTGATTYTIQRSTDNSTWTTLAPKPALSKTSVSYSDTTVSAGTKYYYEISVTNASGKSAFGSSVSALTLPGVPAGLAGNPTGSGQVTLTWTAVTSATSYLVERSTDGKAWTGVGSVASTTFIDAGLPKGATFKYRVTAFNPTGAGAASALVSVTTALAPVTDLTLTSTSPTDVTLTWTAISGAAKYKIERSTNNSTWTTLSLTTTGTTKTVDDKTVLAGTTYYYRITALATAASGNSPVSGVKVITTLLAAPAAPTLTVVTGPAVNVSWGAIAGATGYILQSSTSPTSGFAAIDTTSAASTSFSDTGLTAKTKYYFRLIAVDQAGNSAAGAVASTTTGAT
jgi:titin